MPVDPRIQARAERVQADQALDDRSKLIDLAAERGYCAMFEGVLADGIERELWRKVVEAVLATPGLMVTPLTIETIVKQTMERTTAQLRLNFDQELRGYADAFEAAADEVPEAVSAPGLRTAAELLRKVVDKT